MRRIPKVSKSNLYELAERRFLDTRSEEVISGPEIVKMIRTSQSDMSLLEAAAEAMKQIEAGTYSEVKESGQ
jgi:hypothetical protein